MIQIILSENWFLQSSRKVAGHGGEISTADYSAQGWYPVTVPATVVSGLVESGVYDDPYVGLNMQSIPGYKHGKTTHFSFHPMPDDSPFRIPWWYRNEFTLPPCREGDRVWMQFNGINYRANIWCNGKRIAAADEITGSFRRYVLDVTSSVRCNSRNVLALEVFPPTPDDLSITFIDWSPVPPDDSMGIWQPVAVRTTGQVAIQHPFVRSRLHGESFHRADLVISAELVNSGRESVTGVCEGTVADRTFMKTVTLRPQERMDIRFDAEEFEQLTIENPRLWWPYQLGIPAMYTASLQFSIHGELSDTAEISFGIRDIRSRINSHGARQFTVNGKDILIRGSAWTPDLMLRQSSERDRIDIALLKHMNLNAVRFEGKLASDCFWDICDREGILVLAGWPCCTHWEKWDRWKSGDVVVAEESLRSQILRLRNHPSFIAWFYGSDFPPPEHVERMYLAVLSETCPEVPAISNASARPSVLQGKTGVKMSGPYTYVPPVYWYHPCMPGYADSFNTETCPDVSIPVFESLRKMLPSDQLFPGSKAWNHHAGLSRFTNTDLVNDAVRKRYGEPADTEDFAKTAQVLSYECWRAMFEAYARHFPRGTGVIGWMHNSSWPSMIWQLYDYYLQPTGGFWGTKKACKPLHIQYSYDDSSIWVINNTFEAHDNLSVRAVVMNSDGRKKWEQAENISLADYKRESLFSLPDIEGLSKVYFVFLTLQREGELICRNCYWLSTTQDFFTEETNEKFYWPLKQHADMSSLRTLGESSINFSFDIREKNGNYEVAVALSNNGSTIAFFLWIKIVDKRTNESIVPVYWSDNCMNLMPGEVITVTGIFKRCVDKSDIEVIVDKWN